MKINPEDFTFKFQFRENKDGLFPATMILFLGQLEIRGFVVRKSKFEKNSERFVIFPPSVRVGTFWKKIVWMGGDKEIFWNAVQSLALKQFDQEHSEYLMNQLKTEEISDSNL